MEISLARSDRPGKKFRVSIIENGRTKTIYFGQSGAMDFIKWSGIDTKKALERRTNYINRHKARENWTMSGIKTAGFWAKHILWNEPTLSQSIKDTERRFGIKIKN